MADYTPLITRAVAGQDEATRAGTYARAREALERQLRAFEPRLDEAQIRAEIEGLDKAIDAVEASLCLPIRVEEPAEAAPATPPAAQELPARDSAAAPDALMAAAQELPSAPPLDEASVLGNDDSTDDVAPPVLREPVVRPKMPLRHEDGKSRRSLIYAALCALVVMLGIGTMALFKLDNQDPLRQSPQPQTSAVEPSKTEGRLSDDSAARRSEAEEPVAAKKTAPPQPSAEEQPPTSTSTRAFMVLESPGNTPSQFEGAALWGVEADNANPGQKALRVLIAFPGAEMTVDMTLSRNSDKPVTASHLMVAIFETPKGTEPVRELSPLEWRERETIQGSILRGAVVPVRDNVFMLTLDKAAEAANLDLMLRQKWIVFEFLLANNGRRGAVLVEKGASGERAVAEAITAWE